MRCKIGRERKSCKRNSIQLKRNRYLLHRQNKAKKLLLHGQNNTNKNAVSRTKTTPRGRRDGHKAGGEGNGVE